jgi:hypothetical protein
MPSWACLNSPGALIAAVLNYSTLLRGIDLQAGMATASVPSSKRLTHNTNQKYLRASSYRRFASPVARASRPPKLAVVVCEVRTAGHELRGFTRLHLDILENSQDSTRCCTTSNAI